MVWRVTVGKHGMHHTVPLALALALAVRMTGRPVAGHQQMLLR